MKFKPLPFDGQVEYADSNGYRIYLFTDSTSDYPFAFMVENLSDGSEVGSGSGFQAKQRALGAATYELHRHLQSISDSFMGVVPYE